MPNAIPTMASNVSIDQEDDSVSIAGSVACLLHDLTPLLTADQTVQQPPPRNPTIARIKLGNEKRSGPVP
jgi:hypothetical protein